MQQKRVQVNHLSSVQCSVNKTVRFKTSMLRLYLCDYSDAYIVLKGKIDLLAAAANENDKVEKDVAFKNTQPARDVSGTSPNVQDLQETFRGLLADQQKN